MCSHRCGRSRRPVTRAGIWRGPPLIPVPDRGYWALHAAGRAPVTPRLAPAGRNTQLVHEIVSRPTTRLINGTEPPRLTIEVPDTLPERHPLTEQLDAHLRTELGRKHCGAVRPATSHQCLDVRASANTHARVLLIVDTMIRNAEARGHTVEVTPVSPSRDPYRMRSDTGSLCRDSTLGTTAADD